MLIWFVETTMIAALLAAAAALAGRCFRLAPVARHAFWLVVLIKLVTPPIIAWPRTPVTPVMVHATRDMKTPAATLSAMVKARLIQSLSSTHPVAVADQPAAKPSSWPSAAVVTRGLLGAWGVVTILLAVAQAGRIVRFRRCLRLAVPAPSWLDDEARLVGDRLGVKSPEILVIPGAMTPLLWCLGRPRLILPEGLVKTLDAQGWRGILAHELAHLKRRDHWVRRLELLAGLVWWWNPVFWVTRSRLDAEAELACDECAVRAFPEERLAYAEALLEVCRSISPVKPPVPALGIAGVSHFLFLERRVSMILKDPSPSRPLTPVLLSAGLLAMLAMPAWSSAVTPDPIANAPVCLPATSPANLDDDDDKVVDDDDDDAKAEAKAKAKVREAEKKARKKARARAKDKDAEVKVEIELDSKIEQANELAAKLSEKLGPGSDFEKAMQKLGPELEKSMKGLAGGLEAALGPDSEFAKEMQKAFGPDSNFAREMKEAFGPDSDLARELKETFGPDGEFAKEMKEAFGPDGELARELKQAFGPDGEVARELKAAAEEMKAAQAETSKKAKTETQDGKTDEKAARAKARAELKAQIEALSKKLEELEDDDNEDEDKDAEKGEDDEKREDDGQ